MKQFHDRCSFMNYPISCVWSRIYPQTLFYGRNINYGWSSDIRSARLENIDRIKNLGVTFDHEYTFGILYTL